MPDLKVLEKQVLERAEKLGIVFGLHIGLGVFSDVFSAEYKSNKVVLKCTYGVNVSRKAFTQEMIVCNLLKEKNHQNVVQIVDVFPKETLKQLWIVMEWTNGKDMNKVLSAQSPVPFAEGVAKNYFKQLVSGLKFLHSLGIVHRDIKPSNILIGPCGDDGQEVIKYIDFGFAKLVSVKDSQAICGSHKGSPIYMAPEVMTQKPEEYDAFKSDIYSLAIVLYEMLFYYLPFGTSHMGLDDPERNQIMWKLKKNLIIRYPEEITVSECVKQLIESMICDDSDQRFSIKRIEASEWMQN